MLSKLAFRPPRWRIPDGTGLPMEYAGETQARQREKQLKENPGSIITSLSAFAIVLPRYRPVRASHCSRSDLPKTFRHHHAA